MSDTPTIAEKILALPLGEPAMRVPVYLDKLDFSLGGFIAGQMIDIRSRAATLAAEREAEQAQRIADLSAALARNAATRFAGWFHELPSGMSYRLWEQGGHDQQPGEVALYEADDGAAQRIAELEAENAALRADAERVQEQFTEVWRTLPIPGEFDAMDETDQGRWRGVIESAFRAGRAQGGASRIAAAVAAEREACAPAVSEQGLRYFAAFTQKSRGNYKGRSLTPRKARHPRPRGQGMTRLTDNDRHFGPLTWAKSSWSPWRLVYSSGGGDDGGERFNSLTAYAFGWVARVRLPRLLRPWRRWVDTSRYSWSTSPAGGYWDAHPREYGFSLHEGFLQVFLGAQTGDSDTTQDWCCHLPWTDWRFVRFTLYDLDGREFWTQRGERGDFDAQREATALAPKAVFDIEDYDGARITATTHIEEREWRLGTKWCKWLSLFARPKVRRSLSIKFDAETGPEKGSWKGGTIGTGIEMLAHEDATAAFQRYCEETHRAKSRNYRVTYRRRIA